ncbi:hypothetical protein PIB30_075656 [Stylosanthes scabra]|uniref:Protein kinase domain-containing protein n=1 Tax=Stylosanthes scabra TaxID=79078 RepID=A0ABU6RQ66_9FABA|nr:hypothetical protein [Stylosanthes scabra]
MEHNPRYIIHKNLKNLLPGELRKEYEENESKMNSIGWKKTGVLGAGSYGTVYIATVVDMQTRYKRVLKIIAVKTSSKPTLAFSLKKEEQILQSFSGCQEIVQCFGSEITVEGGIPLYNLFLEYASYGSLADLIHKKPLPESEVRIYTRMIVKGLSRIHREGIAHCDLKPDNILLFRPSLEQKSVKFQLKIADFGLSKTKDEVTDIEFWKSRPRGTLSYLSPEAFSGYIDAPMDIWALGCTVLEMLTGLPAWGVRFTPNYKNLKFLVGSLKNSPKPPNGLSLVCFDFLGKCFEKDPSKRWTADMLLHHHPFISTLISLY